MVKEGQRGGHLQALVSWAGGTMSRGLMLTLTLALGGADRCLTLCF